MKKNMNDLGEVCREMLVHDLEGKAEKDIYTEIYGEPSTNEFKRRLSIINDFLSNELENDGSEKEATHIKKRLEEKISAREK